MMTKIDMTLATSHPHQFLEQVARQAYAAVVEAKKAHDSKVEQEIAKMKQEIAKMQLTTDAVEEYRVLNSFGKDDKDEAITKAFEGMVFDEAQLQSIQKILPELLIIQTETTETATPLFMQSTPGSIQRIVKRTQQSAQAVTYALNEKKKPIEKTVVVIDATMVALSAMMSEQQMKKAWDEAVQQTPPTPSYATLIALDKAASHHVLTGQLYKEVKPESTFSWLGQKAWHAASAAYDFADKISHEIYPREEEKSTKHKPKH